MVLGSPTWFFMTCMPLRSYLKSDEARTVLAGKPFSVYVVCRRYWHWNLNEAKGLGISQGGKYIDGVHFTYEGGQIRSLLSLLSYFGKGEMRERSLGIKIPPTNLKPDFGDQATAFANTLADSATQASRDELIALARSRLIRAACRARGRGERVPGDSSSSSSTERVQRDHALDRS